MPTTAVAAASEEVFLPYVYSQAGWEQPKGEGRKGKPSWTGRAEMWKEHASENGGEGNGVGNALQDLKVPGCCPAAWPNFSNSERLNIEFI